MGGSTTITVRVSSDLKEKLGRLAHDTRRSRSLLAAEAVSSFVDRELAIIGDIRQGLDDVEAKHIVSQEDAAIEVFAVIESAAQKRSA